MPESILDTEAQIIEEFSMFDDWMDKYQYIIDMGNDLNGVDASAKTEENIVHGCQSQVWLTASVDDGHIFYQADSDAIITKGLIAMLIRVLSGHSPDEVIAARLDFVDAIGIREHLSPTRSNGLVSMIKQMKNYAVAFKAKAG